MTDKIELRPEVQWFAEQMELKLRANDHKGGWANEDLLWLWSRIREEWEELHTAIFCQDPIPQDLIVGEAADVANFAMMVADNARRRGE